MFPSLETQSLWLLLTLHQPIQANICTSKNIYYVSNRGLTVPSFCKEKFLFPIKLSTPLALNSTSIVSAERAGRLVISIVIKKINYGGQFSSFLKDDCSNSSFLSLPCLLWPPVLQTVSKGGDSCNQDWTGNWRDWSSCSHYSGSFLHIAWPVCNTVTFTIVRLWWSAINKEMVKS